MTPGKTTFETKCRNCSSAVGIELDKDDYENTQVIHIRCGNCETTNAVEREKL
jgi:hypothetical protein